MKKIKVTNKTKGVLVLSSDKDNSVSLNPDSSLVFTHEEYVAVAYAANSLMNSNMVEIAHLEPEGVADRERILAAVQPNGEVTFTSDKVEDFEPVSLTEDDKVAEDEALLKTINQGSDDSVDSSAEIDRIKKRMSDLKVENKTASTERKAEIADEVAALKEQYNQLSKQ